MSNRKTRKRSRKRRNALRGEIQNHQPRVRGSSFQAKSRSGDAVNVDFQFSGVLVPFEDPANPETNFREKTEIQKRLEENLPQTVN